MSKRTAATRVGAIGAVDLDALAAFDTPTICNALERLSPELQGHGYTTRPFVCGFPQQKPVVGYARAATIRSAYPPDLCAAAQRSLQDDYYRYIDTGPRPSHCRKARCRLQAARCDPLTKAGLVQYDSLPDRGSFEATQGLRGPTARNLTISVRNGGKHG